MFDKYSKRNTKSMSNKRNCLKHLFLISLIAMLFASCSPSAPKPNETASVRIEVLSLSTASIVPGTPNPTNYKLEMKSGDNEPITAEDTTGSFSLTEVPIGTYTVKITAYDSENAILEGTNQLTVKPNGENKVTVIMNYLLDGPGILSVTIDWANLTANNQVYTAIHEYKALGFRAIYAEGDNKDKPLNGINDSENADYIQWVNTDKLTSGSYEYRVEGLNPTSGTAIVFQIYTKINGNNQLIAETFPTVMQIYDGLVSKPDQNEGQNFKLDANHIISYLENISNPDYSINEKDPSTSVDITWKNPTSLDADNLPFYVLVTAIDNDNTSPTIQVKSDPYKAAGGEGSVTIKELKENHTYNIKFQVIGKEGYSNNTQLLTGVQPKIVVEKIEFVNTLNDSYTMGNSITIEGKVSPDNASNKDYKITITDGDEIKKEIDVTASTSSEERTFKFETSGNYTITLTSDDNNSKTASKSLKVKLATPTNLQYVGEPNESGITISWNPVESADGYKVIKFIDGVDQAIEIDRSASTTYPDTDVKSGHTYAYKVYAYKTVDSDLNSLPTEATATVNVSNADITIKFPEGTLDLTGIFEGLQDKTIRLGTEDKIELRIAEDFATGTTYEWILNGNFESPILKGNFNDASFLTIKENTEGLKKYPDNAPNYLTLRVKDSSGKELGSITGTFTVINNNSAGKLMEIKTPDNLTNNTVYYGTPIQLKAVFANENATIKPDVTWSSSNSDVMSVDETGFVTTLQKGEPVTIAVTVDDTQETQSITLAPYVKATGISFGAPDVNYLIIENTAEAVNDQVGVRAYNSGKTFNHGLKITTPDNKEYSGEVNLDYDESIISIDSEGNINPLSGGVTTITATIDDETALIDVIVLDLDLKYEGNSITGKAAEMSGGITASEYILELVSNHTLTNFTTIWCFNDDSTNKGFGAWGSSRNNIEVYNNNKTMGLLKRNWNADDVNITVQLYLDENKIATIGFRAIQ